MPIRKENLKRYPPSWREISLRIRERADGRCECRGECGTDHASEETGEDWLPADRCQAENGFPHPVTGAEVVLTVAHLDHQPEHCDDENLVAMCQRCHNRYDAPERRRGIRERIRAASAIADLFPEGVPT